MTCMEMSGSGVLDNFLLHLNHCAAEVLVDPLNCQTLFIPGLSEEDPGMRGQKAIVVQPVWAPKSHGSNKTLKFLKVFGTIRMHYLLVFGLFAPGTIPSVDDIEKFGPQRQTLAQSLPVKFIFLKVAKASKRAQVLLALCLNPILFTVKNVRSKDLL